MTCVQCGWDSKYTDTAGLCDECRHLRDMGMEPRLACKRCGGSMELVSAQDLAKGICALCSLRDRLQMGDIGMAMKDDGTHIGGVMKDNGTRETFTPGGASREAQAGKGRFDLLPYQVIQAVTEVCMANADDKEDAATKSGILLMVWQAFHDHVEYPLTRALMHLLQDYGKVEDLARWYELGAEKYAPRNWEKSLPLWQIESSALRHACKWCFGMTDEPHDIALAWNIAAWLHFVDKAPS